jgi:hypothetical protein
MNHADRQRGRQTTLCAFISCKLRTMTQKAVLKMFYLKENTGLSSDVFSEVELNF